MDNAKRTLIHEALRFAVWAAGEGIAPTKGEDARGPEDFLFNYSQETDGTDWETLPDHIIAALAAKDAELAEVWQQYVDANEARIDAEAQLAELATENERLKQRLDVTSTE